jgi:hypothetical protein
VAPAAAAAPPFPFSLFSLFYAPPFFSIISSRFVLRILDDALVLNLDKNLLPASFTFY